MMARRVAAPQIPVDLGIAPKFDSAALQRRASKQRRVRDVMLGAADRADDDPGPGGLARGLRFRPVGLTSSWEFDRADLRAIEIPQSVIQVLRDVLGAVLVAREITAKRVIVGVIAEEDDN